MIAFLISTTGPFVERGVLHGVIGPNGAGKSTLMDAITGRRKPTRGKVFVDGRDITHLNVVQRRRSENGVKGILT